MKALEPAFLTLDSLAIIGSGDCIKTLKYRGKRRMFGQSLRNLLTVCLLIGLPLSALADIRSVFFERTPSVGKSASNSRDAVKPERTHEAITALEAAHVPLAQTDWFPAFRREIRQLGAVHLRVERVTASGNGPIYHFQCRFQCQSRNEVAGKQIESLSYSARSAAEQVLRDARIWYRRNKPLVSKS